MTIQSVAGSKIFIATASGLPTTYDTAGFAAKTYVEIKQVSNIGDFGSTFAEITFTGISDRVVQKLKGSENIGTQAVDMAYDATDTGQIRVRAALREDASSAVKVVFQDGSTFYYMAKVMSAPFKLGSVDTVTMASASFGLDGKIVTV